MIKKPHHFLLCVLMAIVSGVVFAQKQESVRTETLEMADQIEQRVSQSLKTFLGADSRHIVNVYVKEKKFEAETKDGAEDPSSWLLFGYAAPPSSASGEASGFEVDSVEIAIQVEKSVEAADQKTIEKLAGQVVRGLKSSISVSPTLDPIAEKNSISPNSKGDWLKKISNFSSILAALLVGISILLVGTGFRKSMQDLADGIRSSKGGGSSAANDASVTLKMDTQQVNNIQNSSVKAGGGVATATRGQYSGKNSPPFIIKKNVEIIEGYLKELPFQFIRAIDTDPADCLGVKYIISQIKADSKELLKNLLGIERIQAIDMYVPTPEMINFDVGAWLQQLIEKIEIRRLAGGSVIESVLSQNEALLLANTDPPKLFQSALKINTPESWRIATDFLSGDFLRKEFKGNDRAMWNTILSGTLINEPSKIKEAAQVIIEEVRSSVSEDMLRHREEREQKDYFVKRLMPAFVDSLLSKNSGEDDEMILDVERIAPSLAQIIKDQVWTPARIEEVETEPLGEIFNRLDNERKAAILFSLPPKIAETLEGFLPIGTGKVIVLDMLDKLRKTANAAKKESTLALTREFLDFLRIQSKNGQLAMKVVSEAPPKAITDEAEVVEADDDEPAEEDKKAA